MNAQHDFSYIEPVRGLGTTWYARGAAYWSRRVGFAALSLLLAVLGGWLSALVLLPAWTDPGVPLSVRIGATLIGVGITGWAAFATERSMRHPTGRNRRGLAGNSTGLIGRARVFISLVLVVLVCYFLTLGFMSVVFVRCFGREFGGEHEARLRVQARREHHGDPAPLDHRRRRHR